MKLISLELVQITLENVKIIKDRIKKIKDQVFLKISPWKHFIWFGMKKKLATRYIYPFKIVQ